MPLPIVAIVGRPNVGKSTLFNRIINERVAIVEDRPGVTRDRNYARASWMGHQFSIIDTGGITWEDSTIDEEIRAQAEIAIEEADVIVMLADASQGVTSLDERIAHLLYRPISQFFWPLTMQTTLSSGPISMTSTAWA